MTASPPSVSCLLLTRDRLIGLKDSVRSYCNQAYPSRELVLATDGTPRHQDAVVYFVQSLRRPDIRVLRFEPGALASPEALQTVLDSVAADVVCQWVDADRSSPRRLQIQLHHLLSSGADACLLSERLHFFTASRDLFWVEGRTGGDEPPAFPDTLMARRGECCPALPSDELLRSPLAAPTSALTAYLGHVGPLLVRVFDARAPDEARWREFSETHAHDEAFVNAHLPAVREVLPAYQLPRPLLVAARGQQPDSDAVTWMNP